MIHKIGDRCTGCEACANICPKNCISMVENAEGFLFPHIDSAKCVNCGLCEKACPVLSPIPIHKSEKDVKVYALIHKDDQVRSCSSSGGAFSAIAEYVLEQGAWSSVRPSMKISMFTTSVWTRRRICTSSGAVSTSRAASAILTARRRNT